jgi:hypothetical protein
MAVNGNPRVKYNWVEDWERALLLHRRIAEVAERALRRILHDFGGDLNAAAQSIGVDPKTMREVVDALSVSVH